MAAAPWGTNVLRERGRVSEPARRISELARVGLEPARRHLEPGLLIISGMWWYHSSLSPMGSLPKKDSLEPFIL